jgi:MarR family transcriptional regulator, lower aerobic nicotinate degradation pathway regulator
MVQPAYLAGQVSKYGRRELERVLGERGLRLIQHAVLIAIDDLGPLSQQQLADSLDFDKSHLVAQIDHLEEHGLLERTRDPSDRRRNRLALTPAGKELLEQLEPIVRGSHEGLLDALSAAERRTLIALMRRVVDANDALRIGAVTR